MAETAAGPRVLTAVALQTTRHRGDIRRLYQDVHLCNRPVTVPALLAGFQMGAMIPVDLGRDTINTHPGNRLFGFGEFSELLNGRLVLGDVDVTRHAARRCRERHVIARVRIGMAVQTFQPRGGVSLMAERQGLNLRRSGLLSERLDRGKQK